MLLWGEKKESGQIATRTHILKNEKSSLQMGRINYYWEGEKKEQGKYSPHKKKEKGKGNWKNNYFICSHSTFLN